MPGTVVSIDTAETNSSHITSNSQILKEGTASVSITSKSSEGTQKYVILGPSELYPFSDVNDAILFQALELLTSCVSTLELTQRIDPTSDYIGFDDAMTQCRAILRDLFALRSIGDGFASLVNAIIWSLKNKDTDVLSRKQVSVVLEAIKELKRKPLMHFDTATGLIDQLEEADLTVEPCMLDGMINLA